MPATDAAVSSDADLLWAALPAMDAVGNGALRQTLGWDLARYEGAKEALVTAGRVKKGPGKGGSLRRLAVDATPVIDVPPVPKAVSTPATVAPPGAGFSGWVAPSFRDAEAKGLEQKLWSAADELRANSNLKASQYSAPVLGLIFLRFADVRFQAHRAKLEAAAATSRRGSQVDLPSAYHAAGVIYLPPSARWETLLHLPEGEGAGRAVNAAMVAIEADNPHLAATLPRTYESFDSLLLKNLLRTFAEIPIGLGFDAFGRIYEYFLGEFAMSEGQGGGEFYTPSSIVRLLVEVLEPFGGNILDPACGSGGMFVQSAAFVHAHQKANAAPLRIYGQEKEGATAALCRLNLAMHGLEGDIKESITYYEDPHQATGRFDFVLANPPFNVDKVDKGRLAGGQGQPGTRFPWGVPSTDNANYLWISLFASALKSGGRAGFVMANSASDARGSELAIRQKMIQAGLVEAMVSVGSNMFYTVTLPVTLWFLNRQPQPTGKVLFIDARGIYRQIDRAHRDWTDGQIGFLSAIVRLFRGESVAGAVGGDEAMRKLREIFGDLPVYRDVPGLCKAATLNEIEAQGWSLNAGRYVGVFGSDMKEDDDDFSAKIQILHEEFERLQGQGNALALVIKANAASISGGCP